MKTKIFTAAISGFLTCFTAFGGEYSGEGILEVLPAGHYEGAGCSVDVKVSTVSGDTIVEIRRDDDFISFNSLLLEQEIVEESADENGYLAIVDDMPDDSYTGVRRGKLEIGIGSSTLVSIETKRKFLFGWVERKSVECELDIIGN
jgi:hypothetical protein